MSERKDTYIVKMIDEYCNNCLRIFRGSSCKHNLRVTYCMCIIQGHTACTQMHENENTR